MLPGLAFLAGLSSIPASGVHVPPAELMPMSPLQRRPTRLRAFWFPRQSLDPGLNQVTSKGQPPASPREVKMLAQPLLTKEGSRQVWRPWAQLD